MVSGNCRFGRGARSLTIPFNKGGRRRISKPPPLAKGDRGGFDLPVRLVMLHMQADQHQGRAVEQAGDGPAAAGDAQGVELLAGGRFDHAVKFFEVDAGMFPQFGEVEGLQQHQHFSSGFPYWQLGGHDRFVEGGADFNPHRTTVWRLFRPPPWFRPSPRGGRRSASG